MKPLKKLLIRTWFGPLPPWTDQFFAQIEFLKSSGYEFVLLNDYRAHADRVKRVLNIDLPPEPEITGTRKCGDWDPMIGVLFEDELRGYDFWGHYNLDCVFGRIPRFLPDSRIAELDVFGNDPGAVCGPFTLYRNTDKINNLFRLFDGWEQVLSTTKYFGFDEAEFSVLVDDLHRRKYLRFGSDFLQHHDKMPQHYPTPRLTIDPHNHALISMSPRLELEEIMMFHFNRFRQWPVDVNFKNRLTS